MAKTINGERLAEKLKSVGIIDEDKQVSRTDTSVSPAMSDSRSASMATRLAERLKGNAPSASSSNSGSNKLPEGFFDNRPASGNTESSRPTPSKTTPNVPAQSVPTSNKPTQPSSARGESANPSARYGGKGGTFDASGKIATEVMQSPDYAEKVSKGWKFGSSEAMSTAGIKARGSYLPENNTDMQRFGNPLIYIFDGGRELSGTQYEKDTDTAYKQTEADYFAKGISYNPNMFDGLIAKGANYSDKNLDSQSAALYMTNDEKDVFTYLYMTDVENGVKNYSESSAKEYYDALLPKLQKRRSSKVSKSVEGYAKEHPMLSMGLRLFSNAASAGNAPRVAAGYVDKMLGGEGSAALNADGLNYVGESINRAMASGMLEGKNGLEQFLIGAGLSIFDNVSRRLIAGNRLSPAVMAGQVFTSSSFESAANGVDWRKGLMKTVANTAAEFLGESVNVKALDRAQDAIKLAFNSSDGLIKRVALALRALNVAGISEAIEESATEVMNIAADWIILGNKSEVVKSYKEYLRKNGDNKKVQAILHTALALVGDVFESAASGYLSSVASGGAQTVGSLVGGGGEVADNSGVIADSGRTGNNSGEGKPSEDGILINDTSEIVTPEAPNPEMQETDTATENITESVRAKMQDALNDVISANRRALRGARGRLPWMRDMTTVPVGELSEEGASDGASAPADSSAPDETISGSESALQVETNDDGISGEEISDATQKHEFSEYFRLNDNGEVIFGGNDELMASGAKKGIIKVAWSNGDVKEYNGRILGRYGIHKNDYGKYTVTHLQSGLKLYDFEKAKEAERFALALDKSGVYSSVRYEKSGTRGVPKILASEENERFIKYAKELYESKRYLESENASDDVVGEKKEEASRASDENGTVEAESSASESAIIVNGFELDVKEDVHTKTGEPIYIARLRERVSTDDFKSIAKEIKRAVPSAYWYKVKGGFVFSENPVNVFGGGLTSTSKDDTITGEYENAGGNNNGRNIDSDILEGEADRADEGVRTEEVQGSYEVGDTRGSDRADGDSGTQEVRGEAGNVEQDVPSREAVQHGKSDSTADKLGISSERVGSEGRGSKQLPVDSDGGRGVSGSETEAQSTEAEDDDTQEAANDTEGDASGEAESKSQAKAKRFELSSDIDTVSPSIDANLAALEVLDKLSKSGKKATLAQKKILSGFKGWGGVSDILYGERGNDKVKKVKELLGDKAFSEAKASVNNAYYTPTTIIDGIYSALKRLGVGGGSILEPSCGVGNFFGRMPRALYAASDVYGTELDSTTAAIASAIYDGVDITQGAFQYSKYNDNSFDAVIGNVPFDNTVKIGYKGQKYSLHDYFFIKSLDLAKPGGIVAMITSTGSLDTMSAKARNAMADRGNLIAAFRFPAGIFGKNAGTDVITDLLIFQKRAEGTAYSGEAFTNVRNADAESILGSDYRYYKGDSIDTRINEYFLNHPENVIGDLGIKRARYGDGYELTVKKTEDFGKRYEEAIKKLPKAIAGSVSEKITVTYDNSEDAIHKGSDGLYYRTTAEGKRVKLSAKEVKVYEHYSSVAEIYGELAKKSIEGASERELVLLRQRLGQAYDEYVSDGAINSGSDSENRFSSAQSQRLLRNEKDYWKIRGLEIFDKRSKTYSKSAAFTKNIFVKPKIESASSAKDALAISLSEKGKVDLEYMSSLTGRSKDSLIGDLEDDLILTPDGEYELILSYLSGNIYEKLDEAKDAAKKNPKFARNAELLEAAIPARLTAGEIKPLLGAPWIGAEYTKEFAKELFGLQFAPNLVFDTSAGKWYMSGSTYGDTFKINNVYGTKKLSGIDIFEKLINQSPIEVYDTASDGSRVHNEAESREAQSKAEDITEAFSEWIFKDEGRASELVNRYNRLFNGHVALDYTEMAKSITLSGIDAAFSPRDYQKRTVARAVFGGNSLFAHGVGTGKTAEMIMSAMEMKRMGITHRNLFVVPNNKLSDFRDEILRIYPEANVIVFGDKEFNAAGRQKFLGRVASSEFDIAVIGHTSFGMIPVSEDTKAEYIRGKLEELEASLIRAREEQGRNIDKRFLRDLEKRKQALENSLEEILSKGKDSGINFEELGFDGIFVDEAHNFKRLPVNTALNVPDINKGKSDRAEDMDMKLSYVREKVGRVILATATPITNTMSEIYVMTRYVAPEVFDSAGITSFDSFAKNFCTISHNTEIAPNGTSVRIKDRLSYVNVQQMIGLFRQFADVIRTDEVITDLPKAKRITVTSPSTEYHREYMDMLAERSMRSARTDPEANPLLMTNDGIAMATDLRLIGSQLGIPEEEYSRLDVPTSRINQCIERVASEYAGSKSRLGTQLIFLDSGRGDNAKRYTFNLYADLISKLKSKGIPESEIADINDYDTDKKREELFELVNSGKIRVLIGSTAKMGEGLNVQERIVALHHLSAPWRPSDIEQREGRAIRHGNKNPEVRIYTYIQEHSPDAYMYQTLERKADFIRKAMSGGSISELDDVSEFELSAKEIKAIATGNPEILEKASLEKQLRDLKSKKRAHAVTIAEAQKAIATLPDRIEKAKERAARAANDVKNSGKKGDKLDIVIGGKRYFDDRKGAIEALTAKLSSKGLKSGELLGKYRGFELYLEKAETGNVLLVKGENEYRFDFPETIQGLIIRLENFVEAKLPERANKYEADAKTLSDSLESARESAKKTFTGDKQISEIEKRIAEIDANLAKKGTIRDTEQGEESTVQSDGDTEGKGGVTRAFIGSRDEGEPDSEDWKTESYQTDKPGKGKKEVKGVGEITRDIRKRFGIPISTGNFRARAGVQGIYKEREQAIRTRISNNLRVEGHELGHHLDNLYGLTNLAHISEAEKLLTEEMRENYPKSEIPHETVAEFVFRYLQNRKAISKKMPELVAEFEERLSKADRNNVIELADDINAYMSASFRERLSGTIVTAKEAAKRERKDISVGERLGAFIEAFRTEYIDQFEPIKKILKSAGADDEAYILAMNSLDAQSRANYILTGEFSDMNGRYIGKSLIDCLKGIDGKDIKAFEYYLELRHAPEWIEQGLTVFADQELEDIDSIRKEIEKYEAEHPEFIDAAMSIYEYNNNLLSLLEESGLISTQFRRELSEKYPNYIPFRRNVGSKKLQQIRARAGLANQGSTIKRVKGSGLEIMSPLESIIANTFDVVKAASRNVAMDALCRVADTQEGFGSILEQVTPSMAVQHIDLSHIREDLRDSLDGILGGEVLDAERIANIDEGLEALIQDFNVYSVAKGANDKKKIVTVMRDGKPSYYQVHDEMLYNALTALTPKQANGFLRFAMAVGRVQKAAITTLNPVFSVSNFMRDLDTAYKMGDYVSLSKFSVNYCKTVIDVIRNSPEYQLYRRMGGGHSSELSANRDLVKKSLRSIASKDAKLAERLTRGFFHSILHPIETISDMNDFVEQMPRFMQFVKVYEETGDVQKAIFEADKITVNFKRGGTKTPALNALFKFSNASIQGIDDTYQKIKGGIVRPEKELLGILYKFLIFGIMKSAILAWWNYSNDKEGYNNLSNFIKNNYYVISIGDGKFIRIPKARQLAVVETLVQRTIDATFGGDKEAFADFGGYLFDLVNPGFIPTDFSSSQTAIQNVIGNIPLVGTLGEIGLNVDYKGSKIVPDSMKDSLPEEQYYDTTSQTAKVIGEAFGLSPLQIDHFINSFGVIGTLNNALLPVDSSKRDLTLGFARRYNADSVYSTDVYNRVYEMANKAEVQYKRDDTVKNALEYEKYNQTATFITKAKSIIREAPFDEQRAMSKKLQRIISNISFAPTASDKLVTKLNSTDIFKFEAKSPTLKKNGKSVQMSFDDYIDYMSEWQNAQQILRIICFGAQNDITSDIKSDAKEIGIKASVNKKLTEEERVDLYVSTLSKVESALRDKYKKKYFPNS